MAEALRRAWLGWRQYIDNGKLAALLLAVLLLLALGKYLESRLEKQLFLYTACLAVLCICPLTAAVLMLYQTEFYDYQWIWSAVPITLMIAFGGTVFLFTIWENYVMERKRWAKSSLRFKAALKPIFLTLFCVMILILCGSLGVKEWQHGLRRMDKESTQTKEEFWAQQMQLEEVLEAITDSAVLSQNTPCIFAPSEIMEYARIYSGDIKLPYGRNMWDYALNAYTYDIYDESVQDMYQWMCEIEDRVDKPWKEPEPIDRKWEQKSKECFNNAVDAGVNIIILPEGVPEELLTKVEKLLQISAQRMDGYYIFNLYL